MAEVEITSIGPGNSLVAARDELGLSPADIARQLNLSLGIIEQIETDIYTDDIPDAFFRGYIRTYARLVNLDEEKTVAQYSELTGQSGVINRYVPSTDVAPVKIQIGSHLLWFKVLSIVVMSVILILGWMAYSDNQKKNNVVSTELSNTELSNTEAPNTDQLTDDMLADDAASDNEIALVIDKVTEPEANTEIPEGFINSATLTDGELAFTFLDDCWVQVIDSNGEVLAVGLKSSGRRFTVSGVPPITVVLGKPRAISLQYNSEAVDLTIYPAAETARFTLGEEIETQNVSNL